MKKKSVGLLIALLLATGMARGQAGSGTTTLSVTIGAEAALTVGTTAALSHTGTIFAAFTTTTSLTYYIRTSSSGSGSIVLEVTTDFTPAGGPSVGTPPSAGDALTYTTSGQQPGNAGTATYYSTAITASTTAQTNVTSFSASSRSLVGGNTASVAWSLTDDPKYTASSTAYAATVTFTISAT